jgi:hypothetical protein
LPFLDLAAHSQRGAGYADTRWSLSGWGWANFLVPMAFGGTRNAGVFFPYGQSWTSSYYLGMGTLWLALLAVWTARERRVWLLGAAAVIALLFALGENTPVYPALRKIIPQLSLVTYPVKYLVVVVFIAPLLAALALARLQSLRNAEKATVRKRLMLVGIIILALIAFVLFLARRFPFPGDDVRATLLNGRTRAIFLLLTGAGLFLLTQTFKPGLRRIAPLILIMVAWLDVLTHEPAQNPTVAPGVYEPRLSRTKLALNPQPALGESRAMLTPLAATEFIHFAVSDPQNNFLAKRLGYCGNCNLLDAVPKVDGFFSLTPRESDEVQSLLYATTNADFPRLEDFLGVSQITAPGEFLTWKSRPTFLPLVTAGQKPVFLDNAGTLRALTQPDFAGGQTVFLPPAAKSLVTVTNQTIARVLSSNFGTQRVDVEVEAAEPSLVVVAQTWYHTWRAYVAGKPAPLLRANLAFQAVQVPAGRHRIRLAYEDRVFQFGAAVSVCLVLNCLFCLHLLKKRSVPVR